MIQIVVADQGWVLVGNVSDYEKVMLIENSHCIRVWGTSRGLGQLVNGPTEKTILDPMGTVRVKNVVFTMEVDQESWKHVIK
jgi:hypothetical protein